MVGNGTVPIDEPPSLNLALIELRNDQCHWPHNARGAYLFCGHPVHAGKAYCQHHYSRSISLGPVSVFVAGVGKVTLVAAA
jgi:hypothetical protein